MRTLWERLEALALDIAHVSFERAERPVSSAFTRVTTTIRLTGADGTAGLGEDVTYEAEDQDRQQAAGPPAGLAGSWTLGELCAHLDDVELWPAPPMSEVFRRYRRWAYESAALDLALRQAGLGLAEALGRQARPLTYVVSLRLPEPANADPIRALLANYPAMRFKLDPTPSWGDAVIAELAATGAVDTVDLKGFYEGSIVDNPADPGLYGRVAEGLPDAVIEDARVTEATRPVLEGHTARLSWDAPIHGVEDVLALPFPAKVINIKPSRVGSIAGLMALYEHCEREGIVMYGGGQFELGAGREHIQHFAAIFHPDTPNDVAPVGFHDPVPAPGLPVSPLPVGAPAAGLGWATAAGG